MDQKGKQMRNFSSSSSSFTTDLFGPKDSSKTSPFSSSTTLFGSIFGPPFPMVPGRDTPCSHTANAKDGTADHFAEKSNRDMNKDQTSTYEQKERIEPCYYNSSIYYGGQEVYSPTTTQKNINPHPALKKDGKDVDSNETGASRGNWWQGSLYY